MSVVSKTWFGWRIFHRHGWGKESFLQNTLSFKLFSIATSKLPIKRVSTNQKKKKKELSRKELTLRIPGISFDLKMCITMLSLWLNSFQIAFFFFNGLHIFEKQVPPWIFRCFHYFKCDTIEYIYEIETDSQTYITLLVLKEMEGWGMDGLGV